MTHAPVSLTELEAMLEVTTPGPWEASNGSVIGPQSPHLPHPDPTMNRYRVCGTVSAEDSELIAALRNNAAYLISRARLASTLLGSTAEGSSAGLPEAEGRRTPPQGY